MPSTLPQEATPGRDEFAPRPRTVGDLVVVRAKTLPDTEALVFPEARLTYAELSDRVNHAARSLAALGVDRGDRVGLLLPNSLELVVQLLAATTLGAIATPVNVRFKQRELRHIVTNSGMRVLLVSTSTDPDAPDFIALLAETFPELRSHKTSTPLVADAPELEHIVELGNGTASFTMSAEDYIARAELISEDVIESRRRCVPTRATAVLVYTSGTTSAPKGAMISHEALTCLASSIAFDRFLLSPTDRMWVPTGLFHGGAITFVITCLTAGATFVHPGFFNAEATPELLEVERITVAIPAFETIWLPVLEHLEQHPRDLSALRINVMLGVPERLRELARRLPNVTQVSNVAMTESSAFLSLSRLDDPLEQRVTTGGQIMPGMEVRVVDPETEVDLPPNTLGHLLFRGVSAFDGYFREPEITAEVIDRHGWVRSGDLVTLDEDRRLTFVSRLKDMIKVGGENVAAAEVEDHLLKHPAVAMVQVVAAPDGYYGEVPAAFIETKAGASVTESELIDFCIGTIATFRVPRYVRFTDSWPMSGTKVRKIDLRRWIADELSSRGVTVAPKISSRNRTEGQLDESIEVADSAASSLRPNAQVC
ncbi:class I adenylate-forming enzyme family protein [Rhodococcus koreensis]